MLSFEALHFLEPLVLVATCMRTFAIWKRFILHGKLKRMHGVFPNAQELQLRFCSGDKAGLRVLGGAKFLVS
jgi:hypothetical protein